MGNSVSVARVHSWLVFVASILTVLSYLILFLRRLSVANVFGDLLAWMWADLLVATQAFLMHVFCLEGWGTFPASHGSSVWEAAFSFALSVLL